MGKLVRSDKSIWEALAMGKEKAVNNMDTSAFDWRSSHSDFGSPLHAILFGKIRDDKDDCNEGFGNFIIDNIPAKQARLALLRMAMENDADPYMAAPATCDVQRWWSLKGKKTKLVGFAGKSAFECLLAVERAIRELDDAAWEDDLKAIDEAVEILSASKSVSDSISVSEGVIEIWESIRADTESADVIIRVADDSVEVRAHSVVLRGASAVLKAMLSTSGMREGCDKVIEVDCNAQALHLLLALIYTGTTSTSDEEPAVGTILCALDVAHRWQVLVVVQMLASAVSQRINMENFELITDTALRLQLTLLLATCRAFATSHAREMRLRLTKKDVVGFQSPAVHAEVDRILSGNTEGPRKRRRKTL